MKLIAAQIHPAPGDYEKNIAKHSEVGPIKEAVATYTARAVEKLRAQGSVCKKMRLSVRTGMFNPDEAKHANGVVIELPYATNDTRLMTNAVTLAVDHIFRPGYRYSKAEVMLLDLRQPGEYASDLFALIQPQTSDQLMSVMDSINSRWGRGTLRTATVPTTPEWAKRRDLMSQSYTTRVDELWIARAH